MNCSHYAPPTWVSSSTVCKISAESPSPDPPKISKITRSSVSLLFNISGGLRKKIAESDFLDIFLQDGKARYDAVGLIETHDIHDSFDFPGCKVFAEPRRHGGRKRKGGVALLLGLRVIANFKSDAPSRGCSSGDSGGCLKRKSLQFVK